MAEWLRVVSLLAAVLLCALPAVAGVRNLTAEGVISPAWVERAGKREPLKAGMALAGSDRVITGERARVMLRMSEGSAIKLGENAALHVAALAEKARADNSPLVSASLEVAKGVFRFTTGVFGNPRAERHLTVKLGTVTAGVRGTDLWGRSVTSDDLVCLLEGRITVRHEKQEVVMNEPLQTFIVPRNDKPKPLGKVSQKQSDEWAQETEIGEGQGATRAGGTQRIELMRTLDLNAARALETRLKDAGYPAVIDPVTGGQHAVCVLGIASAKDRDALLARLKTLLSGSTP
jgi:hypothetical protein